MLHVIDLLSALVRFFGLFLSISEWHESKLDHRAATRAATNGSRLLLARERMVGSALSLLVQSLLVFSVVTIVVFRPHHDPATDFSMLMGTLVSATLAGKAWLTRAARRKIEREHEPQAR